MNLANCVRIKIDGLQQDPSKEFVPNILITIVDELEYAIRKYTTDIVFITE